LALPGRRYHEAGSYNGYWFMVNSEWGYGAANKLTFYYSNATAVSKTTVNDGRWQHAVWWQRSKSSSGDRHSA